ncbi:MAG: winged helix-turn-helix domain-containing protein [Steroidobacteraceae bacterium]
MSAAEQVLVFGPFQLHRSRKLLLENGVPVRLGSRALELLIVLVERAGEVVGKNELMDYVWPDTIVEENNLRVHITAIRKRLGEGQGGARYIVNVAGRGYTFVATVLRSDSGTSVARAPRRTSLPAPLGRPVGRAEAIAAVVALVCRASLVTLVGAGGIGKSTVAVAAAEQLSETLPGPIHFVDLAAVTDGSMVPAALASAIGMSVASEDPVGRLIAGLADHPQLIVLDNCEHVVAETAGLVARVLRSKRRVAFLATSREPLLVDGEQVHPIPPLALPGHTDRLMPSEAMDYPAIQLFVERASTGYENFQLTDTSVETVASLCRRLDGIPLAIEIVATRVGLVGLAHLEWHEDEAGILRVAGRRTAAERHSSLQSTLDWSYRNLSPMEQKVLQRLSIFRGAFSLDAAIAVVGPDAEAPAALDGIVSLVSKSLVSSDVSGPEVRYRLLNITRAYGSERQAAAGDSRLVSIRHAEYLCKFLEQAAREYVTLSRGEWFSLHSSIVDDVRFALEWAFGADGNERLGARLTVAAVTFGFQLSQIEEFKLLTERALVAVRRLAPPERELEVKLTLALTNLQIRTADTREDLDASVSRVVMLTRESGAPRDLVWPLTNKTLIPLDFGDYATALTNYGELESVARQQDDPFAALAADRVGALATHWAGDHRQARRLAERVLRHPAETIPLVYSQISVDRRVSMRVVLARIQWLEGLADQARDLATEAVALAREDSPNAVCDALGHAAVPIALWRGDWREADRLSALLLETTRRYTLTRWHFAALCFRAVWALRDSLGSAERLLDEETAKAAPLPGLQRDLMSTVSTRWLDNATVARAQAELGGWCAPELLRVAALHGPGTQSFEALERSLARSLQLARTQGALAWELRSAMSLARIWQSRERRVEAFELLAPVVRRFVEGLDTRDMVAAMALLRDLQH